MRQEENKAPAHMQPSAVACCKLQQFRHHLREPTQPGLPCIFIGVGQNEDLWVGGQQRPGAGGRHMGVLLVGEAHSVAKDLCPLCAEQVNDDDRRLQASEEGLPCAWGRRELPARAG